jgi:hypothetical protein
MLRRAGEPGRSRVKGEGLGSHEKKKDATPEILGGADLPIEFDTAPSRVDGLSKCRTRK